MNYFENGKKNVFLEIPDVQNIKCQIYGNMITCTWDYTEPAEFNVPIGLRFIYTVIGSGVERHHPSVNTTVDVKLRKTAMWVSEQNSSYDMTVEVYEGCNTVPHVVPKWRVEQGGKCKCLIYI